MCTETKMTLFGFSDRKHGNVYTHIHGLLICRFLPTKTNKRMKEINNEMRVLMNNVISKRENQMKMGETCNDDLLGILLESSMKAVEEDGNKMNGGLSIDEVVEECKDFYLAGRDTTSCLLVWMMVMLGNHLDWQARARDEVLRVFGNNKPDFNGLNNLKVVSSNLSVLISQICA